MASICARIERKGLFSGTGVIAKIMKYEQNNLISPLPSLLPIPQGELEGSKLYSQLLQTAKEYFDDNIVKDRSCSRELP